MSEGAHAAGTLQTRQLLIVEDNYAHARLVMMALAETTSSIAAHWVGDGEEAMAFLNREGRFRDHPEPDLVLLDLRLPTIDGFEVLSWMKSHDRFKAIPVVILSSSSHESDVRRAEEAGASAARVKPATYDEWCMLVSEVVDTWCVRRTEARPLSARGRADSDIDMKPLAATAGAPPAVHAA